MALTRITKGVIKPNENYDTHNINSTGIVTAIGLDVNGNADVSGSLSVGGVLTYEDVTSIDSVGIITARTGLVSPYADIDDFVSVGSNIHLGNAGVVTATSFVGDGSGLIGVASTDNIVTGTAATFNTYPVDINAGMTVAGVSTFTGNIFATGTFKFSKNVSESFEFDSGGNLLLNTVTPRIQLNDINSENDYQIMNGDGTFVIRDLDRSVSFYSVSSAGQQTFTGNVVLNNDLDVDGHTNLDNLNIAGVSTFAGTLNASTVSSTALIASGDLDVDGHTNLDNVSIAGVTTFSSDITTQTIFPQTNNSKDIGSSSLRFRDLYLSNDISLIDSGLIKLGDNNELLIQHTGSDNFIEGGSGFSGSLHLRAKLNQNGVKIESDGPVTLHHSGTAKLVTSSGGVGVTGDITVSGSVDGVDIAALNTTVGTKLANLVEDTSPQLGADLQSNGHHIQLSQEKFIKFGSTGTGIAGYSSGIYFEGNGTGATIFIRPKLNQESIKALPNGAVLLHHSGNQKLTTESDGVTVNGLMEASRTRNTPLTTTERNALGTPDEGTMIYNSTIKKLQVYTDGQWVSFSGKVINTGGGTVSNNSNRSGYVTHTFTSPGTFSTDGALDGVEIMVIGGGGGGGGNRYGGGGGAGGVIMRPASPTYPINSPAPVVVGSGGGGGAPNGTGSSGSNSTFGTGPTQLIGKGGGAGTAFDGPVHPGRPGGSGGGATSRPNSPGGSATQPGTHGAGTDYGNRGGIYQVPGGGWCTPGGGGAGNNGQDSPTSPGTPGGCNGGIGVQLSISGSATYYAGGGAGGIYNNLSTPANFQGVGGNGGGGSSNTSVPGSYAGHSAPGDGATNSGGGGCGAHGQNAVPLNNATSTGKSGGSGIVIVAYPLTQSGGDIVVS